MVIKTSSGNYSVSRLSSIHHQVQHYLFLEQAKEYVTPPRKIDFSGLEVERGF